MRFRFIDSSRKVYPFVFVLYGHGSKPKLLLQLAQMWEFILRKKTLSARSYGKKRIAEES